MDPVWLTAVATGVLALTTAAAVLRDQIRYWLRHPDFAVQFQPGHPDCHRVPLTWRARGVTETFGAADTHYIRCRIHNTGKIAAENVEVAVVDVRRKDAAGNFESHRMATPWNLVWSHHGSHVLPQLPVGAERHITLGHVVDPPHRRQMGQWEDDPDRGIQAEETLFYLETFVRSNTLEYLLDPGEYQIRLQIAAANADPKTFAFHLNHTGKWFREEEQMYSQGLGLRITP